MSPVLSAISGSTFTVSSLVLPTFITSVTGVTAPTPSPASELPSILTTAVSSPSGLVKGLFEPPQPLTPSQLMAPVHSPAPDQNPFPASDMGLSFLGIMLIVGVLLAGMLMLVTKYWGKRQTKKALEKMQKDEEAQAQESETKSDNTSTYGTEEKVEQIKHTDYVPTITIQPANTVAENDEKEQFIIGESESTDITTVSIIDLEENQEDPATFYNAKRSGIIGASAIYSVDIPTVKEHGIQSASVLFVGEATKEVTRTSLSSTIVATMQTCGQPLQTIAEEDITYEAATKIVSLESIDAVGELFLSSESSTESLTQKDELVAISESSALASTGDHTSHIQPTLALNASDYYTIFKNTATVNVAKLSNPPPRPSRDNTPALYEEDISISELDCFLSPKPSIKRNPNPPQKYAADFEAYCRGRTTRVAASKALGSTTYPVSEKDEDSGLPTGRTLTAAPESSLVTITPCSPKSTLEKDMPAMWQDHASKGQCVPKLKPALKSALKKSTSRSPTTTHGSPLKATPRAASTTYLTVPKISMRTGRMAEPPKADTKTTTMSKRRARSTTIIAPRETVGKVGLDAQQDGGHAVYARGDVLARHSFVLKSSTGRVWPNPSTPKSSLGVMSPISEGTEAEDSVNITDSASPTDARPLKTMNTNTRGSALASKDHSSGSKAKDPKGLLSRAGDNQENTPAHPSSAADTALRRTSRTTGSNRSSLKGSTTGSSGGGVTRTSSTPHVDVAQQPKSILKRSSSAWH